MRTHLLMATAVAAALLAATSSTRAQFTDWTGANSSDWFTPGNWTNGVPTGATTFVTIDTVTPNATVVAAPGATAGVQTTVGQFGTGMLTIQSGGTVSSGGGTVGSSPGSQGTVTVTGARSTWTVNGGLTVGSSGTGTLTIADGGTVSSGGGTVVPARRAR